MAQAVCPHCVRLWHRSLINLLGSYHVFAGKDASKGLGLSSVKAEDAVPDYSTLDETAMKTLDGWYEFFQ